ncbi:hypothetical protein EAH84_14460 [Sphingomonas oligophenolica]|uniref:Mercuric transport protein MerT n=1 Tax=Sphingomonas oligophenolica TaxID=301154 RepID=A0A502C6P9_9SPHN|nr:hypothetical protein EAH84_14460 [Sphingomonas oligophenolica]
MQKPRGCRHLGAYCSIGAKRSRLGGPRSVDTAATWFAAQSSPCHCARVMKGNRFFGAAGLASAGLAASFGLAACCALPIILAGAGVGTAWLAGPISIADPIRGYLTPIAALALGAAAFLVLRSPKSCAPGDLCARPVPRIVLGLLVVIGGVLLYLSTQYA